MKIVFMSFVLGVFFTLMVMYVHLSSTTEYVFCYDENNKLILSEKSGNVFADPYNRIYVGTKEYKCSKVSKRRMSNG